MTICEYNLPYPQSAFTHMPDTTNKFGYCHAWTVSNTWQFYTHNSLPSRHSSPSMEYFSRRRWATIPTGPISKLLSPWRLTFFVSAVSGLCLKLLYRGARMVVHLLLLKFSMDRPLCGLVMKLSSSRMRCWIIWAYWSNKFYCFQPEPQSTFSYYINSTAHSLGLYYSSSPSSKLLWG